MAGEAPEMELVSRAVQSTDGLLAWPKLALSTAECLTGWKGISI
jgi:hypothetical protein